MPRVGQVAPDFTLPSSQGGEIRLKRKVRVKNHVKKVLEAIGATE